MKNTPTDQKAVDPGKSEKCDAGQADRMGKATRSRTSSVKENASKRGSESKRGRTKMNPYHYTAVPIDRHWPEILPRIRHDAHFAELVVKGLHSFTGGRYRLDADIWSVSGAPWAWSRGDGWHVQAEAAFEISTAPADVAIRNAFRAEIECGDVEETETAKR